MIQSIKNFIRLSKEVLTQKSFAKIMLDKELVNHPKFNQWEADLFTRLKMSNGTAKMTFANRMPELDNYITNFSNSIDGEVQIQDVGISSGVSTYELYQQLDKNKKPFNLIGGDAFIKGKYAQFFGKNINILCEPNGYLLEVDFFGLVCSSAQKKYGYIWYFLFFPIIDLWYKSRGSKIVNKPAFKDINLVSQYLKNQKNIETVTDNVLASSDEYTNQFDIVRAANIINLSYFNTSQIKTIVANLTKRLKVNGILIINRTNYENINNGHVYQLTEDKTLNVIHQFGSGSEVHHLVIEENA